MSSVHCENVFLLRRYKDCNESLLQKTKSNREVFQRRNIQGYERMLGKDLFRQSLSMLDDGDTWIDMGAGRAKAMIGYYRELKKLKKLKKLPNMIAVSMSGKGYVLRSLEEDNSEFLQLGQKIPILKDLSRDLQSLKKMDSFKYIEVKVGSGKLLKMKLPKAKLITDVWGPMAYTNRADRVLNEYLSLLEVNGQILIHMHWKRYPRIFINDKEEDFLEWLSAQNHGIKIENIVDSPLAGTYRITKLKRNAQVASYNLKTKQ